MITEGIIIHLVNCRGALSEIDLNLRKRFPKVFTEYKQLCDEVSYNPHSLLGTCQIIKINDSLYVANLFSQEYYKEFGCQTDYVAVNLCLKEVEKFSRRTGLKINIPNKINNCDWSIVEVLIKNNLSNYEFYTQ